MPGQVSLLCIPTEAMNEQSWPARPRDTPGCLTRPGNSALEWIGRTLSRCTRILSAYACFRRCVPSFPISGGIIAGVPVVRASEPAAEIMVNGDCGSCRVLSSHVGLWCQWIWAHLRRLGQVRSGQVYYSPLNLYSAKISVRPHGMRVTRQLGLPPRYRWV